jgi:hypothetical protein
MKEYIQCRNECHGTTTTNDTATDTATATTNTTPTNNNTNTKLVSVLLKLCCKIGVWFVSSS